MELHNLLNAPIGRDATEPPSLREEARAQHAAAGGASRHHYYPAQREGSTTAFHHNDQVVKSHTNNVEDGLNKWDGSNSNTEDDLLFPSDEILRDLALL